jgi:hypothetical protein
MGSHLQYFCVFTLYAMNIDRVNCHYNCLTRLKVQCLEHVQYVYRFCFLAADGSGWVGYNLLEWNSVIPCIQSSLQWSVTFWCKMKYLKMLCKLYFNKQWLKYDLVSKYTKIHIPHTSPAAVCTQQKIWIKDEIKFLYTKKQNLTQHFYNFTYN